MQHDTQGIFPIGRIEEKSEKTDIRKKERSNRQGRSPEKVKEYCQRYYRKYRDAIRAKRKAKYITQRDAVIARSKSYYKQHREEIRAKFNGRNNEQRLQSRRNFNLWYSKNRAKFLKQKYQRDKILRLTDPLFVIRDRIRSRVRQALKRQNATSSQRILGLLGCTLNQFHHHIEEMFRGGMTWTNIREWHLDHIIPLSSFDLTDSSQLQQACHYTNVQPLWASENIRKGSKILNANKKNGSKKAK